MQVSSSTNPASGASLNKTVKNSPKSGDFAKKMAQEGSSASKGGAVQRAQQTAAKKLGLSGQDVAEIKAKMAKKA